MTPRIATVLSARDWESDLVRLARDGALVRLVLRAYRPEDLEKDAERVDVVVAGAETSWVTPARVAAWRRAGLRVIGIYAAGDHPARDRLEAGGADEIFPDDTPLPVILQAIRFLRPAAPSEIEAPSGSSVAVAGPRGAPGRTEVALALAWQWATNRPTLLIDLDLEAPAIAIRLGRPPRPDISDVADAVHANGRLPTDAVQQVGRLNLIVGSHRAEEPALRPMLVDDVVEAALGSYELVVLDLGPRPADDGLLKQSDHAVVVAEASPNGLVRAARLTAEWSGPPPALVLNRIPNVDRTDVIRAARRWTGLDPIALVPDRQRIREAARAARPPDRILSKALARLEPPR